MYTLTKACLENIHSMLVSFMRCTRLVLQSRLDSIHTYHWKNIYTHYNSDHTKIFWVHQVYHFCLQKWHTFDITFFIASSTSISSVLVIWGRTPKYKSPLSDTNPIGWRDTELVGKMLGLHQCHQQLCQSSRYKILKINNCNTVKSPDYPT